MMDNMCMCLCIWIGCSPFGSYFHVSCSQRSIWNVS